MNRFKNIALRLLPPVLVPKAWGSPYEAANWSPRRGTVPGASPTDARNDLTPGVRTELVRKSRYLHKNSGFVRELVGNMAIYSTGDGIRVQAQSAKPDWNRAAEDYFSLWSARCAPIFYRVLEDGGKARDIPAESLLHLFEPEWAGGVRAHPTIQHSINHVLDEMELLALEKHAVKDNADVSRILKTSRGEIDDNGDFIVGGTGGTGDTSDPVSLQRIVGGKLVALKPDESLDSFQSNRPSPTFTGFLEHLRRDSALGMIPFEFAADSSKIGGAGVRLIVAKADRRFSFRQMILERRFIRPVWAYVIGDAINRGMLPPIAGWWKISSVPPKRVTVDAGREAQQNRADVEMGLKTLSDHFQELGADFGEEIERRASDAKLILETAAKYGVPVDMLWKPSGASSLQQPALTPQTGRESGSPTKP